MKRIVSLYISIALFCFSTVACGQQKEKLESAHKIIYDESSVKQILSEKSKTTITDISISDDDTPWEIRTGPSVGMLMTIPCSCLGVTYGPLIDTGNSGFIRTLYIPLKYVRGESITIGDTIYYNDRWNGKGPRFDSQGGTMTADEYIVKLVRKIDIKE